MPIATTLVSTTPPHMPSTPASAPPTAWLAGQPNQNGERPTLHTRPACTSMTPKPPTAIDTVARDLQAHKLVGGHPAWPPYTPNIFQDDGRPTTACALASCLPSYPPASSLLKHMSSPSRPASPIASSLSLLNSPRPRSAPLHAACFAVTSEGELAPAPCHPHSPSTVLFSRRRRCSDRH